MNFSCKKMQMNLQIFTQCRCAFEWKRVLQPCVQRGVPARINSNEGQMCGCGVTAWEAWELWATQKRSEDDSGRDEGRRSGRETSLSEQRCARCALRFPMSASWKISPGKQRGYWEEKRGGAVHNEVCTGRGIMSAFLCVSGDGRDTVHSSGIRGLMKKKKKQKGLASEWLRWREERLSNPPPPAGSRDLPCQICKSEQPPWVWEIGFPWLQQVAAMEVASVICRFWRRQC